MKKPSSFVQVQIIERQLLEYKDLLSFLQKSIEDVENGSFGSNEFYELVVSYLKKLEGAYKNGL